MTKQKTSFPADGDAATQRAPSALIRVTASGKTHSASSILEGVELVEELRAGGMKAELNVGRIERSLELMRVRLEQEQQ